MLCHSIKAMEACEDENLEFFIASGEDDDCQAVGDIMMDPENMGCMNVRDPLVHLSDYTLCR